MRTIAERLGHQADAKLLIVHADDLGLTRSVNEAAIKAFETGYVRSGSMMVPCPQFDHIAGYMRNNPEADLGLHLTLNCEWTQYRWGPVLPAGEVPTLVDSAGHFHPTSGQVLASHLREVELELRAQIERAVASGAKPTHLDSHMFTLYKSPALFNILFRLSREYDLPIPIAREWFRMFPSLPSLLSPNDVVLEQLIIIDSKVPAERWAAFYSNAVARLKPGITEILIHPAYDDQEMRAATGEHCEWGAAWRQRDFDFFTSGDFARLLQEQKVLLTNWRTISSAVHLN